MSAAVAVPRLGSVLARGLVVGALWGAILGVVYLAGLAMCTGDLDLIEVFVPAAVVGGAVGAGLGLLTGLVLASSEPAIATSRRRARWIAAATCGFAVIVVMWRFADGYWALIPMAPMAGLTGAALAPRVLDGR